MTARQCRVVPDEPPSLVLLALRRHMDAYVARYGFDPVRIGVLQKLISCRTEEMGTHQCVCDNCGWQGLAFNSCRDRHCPQCQGQATAKWLEKRTALMLPVPHFQVVFTLPAQLRPIAYDNQNLVYGLLIRTAASILQDLAAQRFDAQLGITAVLHTSASDLTYHPHAHLLVSAGGLSLDQKQWVHLSNNYLFPNLVVGAMFKGRFLEALIEALDNNELQLRGEDEVAAAKNLRSMVRKLSKRHRRWVVHIEPPNGRPVEHVTKYLARYVKRVAISDARIVDVSNSEVVFRSRKDIVHLPGVEFVRRFSLHILPKRFRKIRHYGLYAPSNVNRRLEVARSLIVPIDAQAQEVPIVDDTVEDPQLEICPACGQRTMRRVFSEPALDLTLPDLSPLPRGPP